LLARLHAEAVPVGGVRAVGVGLDFVRNPILAIARCHQRWGPAIELSLTGPGRRVWRTFLLGPSYNREILSRPDWARPAGLWNVSGPSGSAQAAMRRNYLATSGPEHASLARTVVPQLSRTRTLGFFDSVRDVILPRVKQWRAGDSIELFAELKRLGYQAGIGVLFGEPSAERAERFGELLSRYHLTNWRWRARLKIRVAGWPYTRLLAHAEEIRDFVRDWVGDRPGCPAGQDLRSALNAHRGPDGCPLTLDQLTAHTSVLGFAGYETMSSSLTWTLLLLSLHPAVLADLLDELAAAPALETIEPEALDSLPLLDAVVRESLRLVSPAPLLPWRTIRLWPIDGVKTRLGLVLNPHLTHRNPDLYSEPLRFRPGRWATIRPDPFEYLPFSAGPRRCPGGYFGAQFIKVGLAAILPRWRLVLEPGGRIDWIYRGLTIPKQGLTVGLRAQDRSSDAPRIRGNLRDLVQLD
jgi:cytochrome P450